MLWISLDDTHEAVAKMAKAKKLPGIQTWDESARDNPVAETYNVHSLPTWYIIDQGGTIAARNSAEEKLIPAVERALGDAKTTARRGD